jgi:hypothetical protein
MRDRRHDAEAQLQLGLCFDLYDGDESSDDENECDEADFPTQQADSEDSEADSNSSDEAVSDNDEEAKTEASGKLEETEEQKQKKAKVERAKNKLQQKQATSTDDEWIEGAANIAPPLPQTQRKFVPTPSSSLSPMKLLQLFLTNKLINVLVKFTNKFAHTHGQPDFSTDSDEMYAFIAAHIYMGIDRLPRLSMYWSLQYSHPFITQLFTRARFKLLLSQFCACDPVDDNTVDDPALHTRKLIIFLNATFPLHFQPTRDLCIDESIVAFKGRAAIKIFDPSKPHRFGYKVYGVACDGYMMNMVLYQGASEQKESEGKMHSLVTELMKPFHNNSHILYIDNYFTSLKLLDSLASVGIATCGSVRLNRVSKSLVQQISDTRLKKMTRGESLFFHNKNRAVIVWKDSKYIKLLCNHLVSPTELTSVVRWSDENKRIKIPCPVAVKDYFHHARYIDRVNQLHYSYPTGRKAKKAWPRLVWWLIDICIVNAYKLWAIDRHCPTQLDFRSQLMHELAAALLLEKKVSRETEAQVSHIPLAKYHYPRLTHKLRDCKHCSSKSANRVKSAYICAACNVHLCVDPCFGAHHQ